MILQVLMEQGGSAIGLVLRKLMLSDLLHRFSARTGLIINQDRDFMVQLINDAARELYTQEDLPGILREARVGVVGNSYISLPNFVGTLKAMRHSKSQYKIVLMDLRPKYSDGNWAYEWSNWRVIGRKPLAIDLKAASKLSLVTAANHQISTVDYTISGKTLEANLHTEVLKEGDTTTATFIEVVSIRKSGKSIVDTKVKDEENEVLAEIPNDRLISSYLHIDVSQYPWPSPACPCSIEILYKPGYSPITEDTDSFIIPELEDAVYYMSLGLWYLTQKDEEQRAGAFAARANNIISKYRAENEGSNQKFMSFSRRKTYDMWGSRYSTFSSYPKH